MNSKTIMSIMIVTLLYIFDDVMFDLADFKCQVHRDDRIGYPVRTCSLAFDDRGLIGKAASLGETRRAGQ
jgi:hypothetical protein